LKAIQKVTNANVVTPIKVETFKKWLLSFPKKELQFCLIALLMALKFLFKENGNTEFHH
jgi:hypothetical protein